MIASLLSLTALTSCSDFLNEELKTNRNTDYFDTNEGMEAMMNGIYFNLRFQFAFEWGVSLNMLGTDEFLMGGDGSNTPWSAYTNLQSTVPIANENTTRPFDLWDRMYQGIASANTMIVKIDNYTGSMRDEILGTAHFMRGYNYFKLVSQYGGVPLKLTPSTTVEREFTRASAQEVTTRVFLDMLEAYDKLPPTASTGKLNKKVVAFFLAKAYLWRASEINDSWNAGTKAADLDNVIKYAKEVIDAHPLADNFQELWAYTEPNGVNENLPEIVLAAQFYSDVASQGGGIGPGRGNNFHLFCGSIYDNLTGVGRDISGGRPYQRIRTTYYTYNVYNRLDDSRFWKSFRTMYQCNREATSGGINYFPGDIGIIYMINKPGDDRFSGTQNSNSYTDVVTGKIVPTVFVLYPDGSDGSTNPMEVAYNNRYAPLSKYMDGSRPTIAQEAGYRDGILARSAEAYIFVAEAYIRKGDFDEAIKYINPLRKRAQWTAGEEREKYTDGGAAWNESAPGWNVLVAQPSAVAGIGAFVGRSSYYESNDIPMGSLNSLSSASLEFTSGSEISTLAGLPAEDRAIAEKLGYTEPYDIAMCFLLNEKTREFVGETQRWEDLARTRTLIARARAFNSHAAPNIQDHHVLRPIPQTYLDVIQRNGSNLTTEQKKAEQNLGYN